MSEELTLKVELANLPEITILHMVYQQKAYEGHAKDHEFSGTSMREHWQSGYEGCGQLLMYRYFGNSILIDLLPELFPPGFREHERTQA